MLLTSATSVSRWRTPPIPAGSPPTRASRKTPPGGTRSDGGPAAISASMSIPAPSRSNSSGPSASRMNGSYSAITSAASRGTRSKVVRGESCICPLWRGQCRARRNHSPSSYSNHSLRSAPVAS